MSLLAQYDKKYKIYNNKKLQLESLVTETEKEKYKIDILQSDNVSKIHVSKKSVEEINNDLTKQIKTTYFRISRLKRQISLIHIL